MVATGTDMMITVNKQDVANWLLMDYQATLYNVKEKLRFFELKYNQTWNVFEQEIKKSRQEDFSKWDDYIEWKAYLKTAEDIAFKIQEVKNGHFAIT